MKKSEMFGIDLEPDDRTPEEILRNREEHRDRARWSQATAHAPMDTDCQKELEDPSPQIRLNLNFDKQIRGEPLDAGGDRFSKDRLFNAAASGDASELDDLLPYLTRTGKKLSHSLYQSSGKTALMKALLHLRDGRNEAVERLIDVSEKTGDIDKLVNVAFTGRYYRGQTALHIAVERRSLAYVQLLVGKGADVHAKACGDFFQPHDGANFYFGELPLSLAACTNQPDVVDFLMLNEHKRADAKMADSHGNTVLHALVVVADNSEDNTAFVTRMYDRVLLMAAQREREEAQEAREMRGHVEEARRKLEDIENLRGLTPLKLAAKTGKIGIFSHILRREFHDANTKHLSRKFTEWVYGPVHCSLYDLESVDSYHSNSVLDILVYGSDIPNRHEMLETEPLSRLLEEKWRRFAGRMFFLNFLVYLAYLVIFTVVAYNKKKKEPPFPLERHAMGYLYAAGQVFLLLANCYFFVIGVVDMKRKQPKLQTLLIDGYYEILFFAQAVLFLVSAGLYVGGQQEYLGVLVICLAFSWVNLLYYSRGDKHMGIYSVMIQKMILSDILRFLFVYIVFLFGFSAAVVTLLIEPPVKNATAPVQKGRLYAPLGPDEKCLKPSYTNISYTTMQLFKFTIGMGDMEFTQDYQHKEVFYLLLIGYIILTYILLLNMLIALMNRTVEKITMESASIWKLQRAVTIMDMEKRLPRCLRERLRCGVEINLDAAPLRERRHCFRVEEVNWNKWSVNVAKINEDPGYWGGAQTLDAQTPDSQGPPRRGKSWRTFMSYKSRQGYQATEMNAMNI